MKAIIKQELTRKSWSGRTIISVKIIGIKQNIIQKANDYISTRLNDVNKIPVKCFHVEIQTQKGKKVNSWKYMPTYR